MVGDWLWGRMTSANPVFPFFKMQHLVCVHFLLCPLLLPSTGRAIVSYRGSVGSPLAGVPVRSSHRCTSLRWSDPRYRQRRVFSPGLASVPLACWFSRHLFSILEPHQALCCFADTWTTFPPWGLVTAVPPPRRSVPGLSPRLALRTPKASLSSSSFRREGWSTARPRPARLFSQILSNESPRSDDFLCGTSTIPSHRSFILFYLFSAGA